VMNNCGQFNTTKDYEIVMICRKQGSTLAKRRNSSIIQASNTQAVRETGHPFAKPYDVTADLVELVSTENQLILEPFAGGGSLAIEMLRRKRHVIAVEKEDHWFNQLIVNMKTHYLKLNPHLIFK
jgi:DNA modification methylase